MPGQSVSAVQFAPRNTMDTPDSEDLLSTPMPGSASNWGNKRYTAWSTARGKTRLPEPGNANNLGSVRDFSTE